MKDTPEGFKRLSDGVLHWNPGWDRVTYNDPGEAIKQYYAGELRFACNERRFSNYRSHPCGIAAKYDPDDNGNMTKCGHHSAEIKAKRRKKQDDRHNAWKKEFDYKCNKSKLMSELPQIVRSIAEGHNDARSLCLDWITRNNKLEEENK